MQLNSQIIGNVHVLSLSGIFDAQTAPLVRQWFEKVRKQEQAFIVVNLKNVSFLDSTGLSVLVQAMKHARQANGELRLCAMQQPVRMIFELTRLDRVFEIFNNEEEAVRAFSEQTSPLAAP